MMEQDISSDSDDDVEMCSSLKEFESTRKFTDETRTTRGGLPAYNPTEKMEVSGGGKEKDVDRNESTDDDDDDEDEKVSGKDNNVDVDDSASLIRYQECFASVPFIARLRLFLYMG